MDQSRRAIKADAAIRVFDLSCQDITWAVPDTGIDATHPAFHLRKPDGTPEDPGDDGFIPSRVVRTYDLNRMAGLVDPDRELSEEMSDRFPEAERRDLRWRLHEGRLLPWDVLEPLVRVPHDGSYAQKAVPQHNAGTTVAGVLGANWPEAEDRGGLVGICPDIRLIDIRVFDAQARGDVNLVLAAMQLVRHLNAASDRKIVNGVHLGLEVWWDFDNYACGQTPVCLECERLVTSGVVVVVPAGNRGTRTVRTRRGGEEERVVAMGITDPGNAESVLTVGSTHRMASNTYGISYFSSRGPTADGRYKPDLVAPGQRITTTDLHERDISVDGTHLAAAHVSGAAALLMARHGELVGAPNKVKQVLCESATDLGRDRYFQGAGMVDVMRALQVL